MLRAYHLENWERPIACEVKHLKSWRTSSDHLNRLEGWRSWYYRAYPLGLQRNCDALAGKNI
eukprot:11657874-Heterocapsa_arctica.AAC.1